MIHRRPFHYLPLIAVLLTFAALAQKKDEVLLSFSGVLKGISKRELVIEPEPDNQMTFVRSKRTRFLRGGKEIKDDAVKPGTAVTIQSFTRLNGELEAVTVTLNEPADQDSSPIK